MRRGEISCHPCLLADSHPPINIAIIVNERPARCIGTDVPLQRKLAACLEKQPDRDKTPLIAF
jgi:hypothetical protein